MWFQPKLWPKSLNLLVNFVPQLKINTLRHDILVHRHLRSPVQIFKLLMSLVLSPKQAYFFIPFLAAIDYVPGFLTSEKGWALIFQAHLGKFLQIDFSIRVLKSLFLVQGRSSTALGENRGICGRIAAEDDLIILWSVLGHTQFNFLEYHFFKVIS